MFDSFLSYKRTQQDQYKVYELLRLLREQNLSIWFDEDQIRPGISWQKSMEIGIRNSRSGLVLIGSNGIGPWQDVEMQALLQYAVRIQLPLIPVFLPGVQKQIDQLPIFLSNLHWVDLSSGFTDNGIAQLNWGITGQKITPSPLSETSAPKNIDEYISKRGHLIHKLKAKDSTGRWAYYFILVESDLEQAFLQALDSNEQIDLQSYGQVIASCYGEKPNTDVINFLKEKYGFNV